MAICRQCCSMGPGNGDEFLGIWLALPCALTEGAPGLGNGCHVAPACWCSRNSGLLVVSGGLEEVGLIFSMLLGVAGRTKQHGTCPFFTAHLLLGTCAMRSQPVPGWSRIGRTTRRNISMGNHTALIVPNNFSSRNPIKLALKE
jgi:hypothetical protein